MPGAAVSPLHSTGARRMPRCQVPQKPASSGRRGGTQKPGSIGRHFRRALPWRAGGSGRSSICLLLGLRMAAAPGQEKSGAQGGEGGHGDQTEGADDGVDDLRRHILVVQDVVNRGALGHEDHEQGDVAAGVGEEQGGGHGAHGGPAHVEAGAGGPPASSGRDASPPPRGRRR